MDRDAFRGRWSEMQGEIRSEWGKLSDQELTRIDGDMDKFKGVLQERYAYSKQQAKDAIDNFLKRFER